ncbi:hypothetical protein GCHA_0497 [Paraglaciecola chathamensis S18K6]|uniref:Uncharacterized protein n=1 Tax=Paraglaciecola chathamensis S18K6 TaxID=1127672 RepID=A0AAV3UU64_9ALTE|nr:hypothetical protein GCHA_0497 [Paraglaciecola chathamensis S18K6]
MNMTNTLINESANTELKDIRAFDLFEAATVAEVLVSVIRLHQSLA